jgi:geranylgeranyl diphosphate synthase type II
MIDAINRHLDELLSPSLFPPGELIPAARYSVLNGGKRFRSRLVLAASAPHPTKAMIPACAIEFVHTYSLIHDDLPCMDDDDLRRGLPSLHKVYPEGHALLTGNFLLTYAYQLLAEAPLLSPDQKISLIQTLSHRIGAHGMIGGQELDISTPPLNLTTLTDLHTRKTAALITAAVEFGGIIAETDDMPLLRATGEKIGLLFQLLDDLADHDGAAILLGHDQTVEHIHRYVQEIQNGPFPHLTAIIQELIN